MVGVDLRFRAIFTIYRNNTRGMNNIHMCLRINIVPQGFSERLTTECTAKTTSSMKVKVVTGGNTSDRIFSAWVGASILASLGNFQVCITTALLILSSITIDT